MIRTERLLLRRARPDDLEDLHAVMGDARAMRYWDRPAHDDLAQTRRFLEALIRSDGEDDDDFAIEFGGRMIGKAGFWRKAEIGYLIHPDLWGQGLASEALAALIPRAFQRWRISEITAECDPRNTASVALLRKFGFVETGYAEKNFDYGGIEWCDTAYYSLPRPS